MSETMLSVLITVAIVISLSAWPALLGIVYPRCTRFLADRCQRPFGDSDPTSPRRRRTDGRRRP